MSLCNRLLDYISTILTVTASGDVSNNSIKQLLRWKRLLFSKCIDTIIHLPGWFMISELESTDEIDSWD